MRINCYAPGWVDTDMLDSILSQYEVTKGVHTEKNELKNGTMSRPSTPGRDGQRRLLPPVR